MLPCPSLSFWSRPGHCIVHPRHGRREPFRGKGSWLSSIRIRPKLLRVRWTENEGVRSSHGVHLVCPAPPTRRLFTPSFSVVRAVSSSGAMGERWEARGIRLFVVLVWLFIDNWMVGIQCSGDGTNPRDVRSRGPRLSEYAVFVASIGMERGCVEHRRPRPAGFGRL